MTQAQVIDVPDPAGDADAERDFAPEGSASLLGSRLGDRLVGLGNFFLKAKFFLYFLIKGRSLERPYYAHYEVTRRCNFRCYSCRCWREDSYAVGLSIEQMGVLARNLHKSGVKCVALTGGEPLMRRDIVDIVRTFRKAGLIVRLQTNGYLLNGTLLENLFRAGISDLFVSFDSLDQKTFNHINGVKGETPFKRVKQGVIAAAKLARRFNASVFLNVTLRGDNAGEVIPLHQFAKDHGMLIGFFGMEVPDAGDSFNVRINDHSIKPSAPDRVKTAAAFDRLIELKRAYDRNLTVSERILNDFKEYFRDPGYDLRWKCHAGKLFLAILPEGAVSVCNGAPPIAGYDYKNLPDLYARKDREDVFMPSRMGCSGCICMRQLEYMAVNRKDLFDKGVTFVRSLLGFSPR